MTFSPSIQQLSVSNTWLCVCVCVVQNLCQYLWTTLHRMYLANRRQYIYPDLWTKFLGGCRSDKPDGLVRRTFLALWFNSSILQKPRCPSFPQHLSASCINESVWSWKWMKMVSDLCTHFITWNEENDQKSQIFLDINVQRVLFENLNNLICMLKKKIMFRLICMCLMCSYTLKSEFLSVDHALHIFATTLSPLGSLLKWNPETCKCAGESVRGSDRWELISSPDVPDSFHGVCPAVINLEAEPMFPFPLEPFGSTRGPV